MPTFPLFFLLTLEKNFCYSNKGFFKKVGRARFSPILRKMGEISKIRKI
nr:MAG TPA: hypothetical protein [Caudoviricetes sp.]